jgi:hypothetical protein
MFTNAPHNLRAAVLTNNAHLRAGSSPAPSRSNSIIDKSFEKSVEKSFEKSVDKSAETNSPVNRSRSPSVSAGHVSPQVQTPPTQTTPSKMPATPVQYAVPFAQQFLIFLPARPQSIQSDSGFVFLLIFILIYFSDIFVTFIFVF